MVSPFFVFKGPSAILFMECPDLNSSYCWFQVLIIKRGWRPRSQSKIVNGGHNCERRSQNRHNKFEFYATYHFLTIYFLLLKLASHPRSLLPWMTRSECIFKNFQNQIVNAVQIFGILWTAFTKLWTAFTIVNVGATLPNKVLIITPFKFEIFWCEALLCAFSFSHFLRNSSWQLFFYLLGKG